MSTCPHCSHNLSTYSPLPSFCPVCGMGLQVGNAPVAYTYPAPDGATLPMAYAASNKPYVIVPTAQQQQQQQQEQQKEQEQQQYPIAMNASKQASVLHPPQQQSVQYVQAQPTQVAVAIVGCPHFSTSIHFDICGVCLAICFFPIGILCCFIMSESRCNQCNQRVG